MSFAAEGDSGFLAVGWKLFLGALGLIQTLIGYIYITGILSVNKKIDKLFEKTEELGKEKLDKEDLTLVLDQIAKLRREG